MQHLNFIFYKLYHAFRHKGLPLVVKPIPSLFTHYTVRGKVKFSLEAFHRLPGFCPENAIRRYVWYLCVNLPYTVKPLLYFCDIPTCGTTAQKITRIGIRRGRGGTGHRCAVVNTFVKIVHSVPGQRAYFAVVDLIEISLKVFNLSFQAGAENAVGFHSVNGGNVNCPLIYVELYYKHIQPFGTS